MSDTNHAAVSPSLVPDLETGHTPPAASASQDPIVVGRWELDVVNPEQPETNPLTWSDDLYRLYGYAPGELIVSFSLLQQHVHPDDRDAVIAAHRAMLRGGRPPLLEYRIIRRDSSVSILVERSQWVRNPDTGKVTKIIGTVMDVSHQRHVESALRETETTFFAAQRLAALGTWEIDLLNTPDVDSWPLRWSTETYRLVGYEPGDIALSRAVVHQLTHPDDRAFTKAVTDRALRQGLPYSLEYRIIRRDGAVRVVYEQSHIITDPRTRENKMVGIVQDITDRKQVEQALRDYNAMLRGVSAAQAKFIAGRPPQETFAELLACLLNYSSSEYGFIGERVDASEGTVTLRLHATAGTGWDPRVQQFYQQHAESGVRMSEWPETPSGAVTSLICNEPGEGAGQRYLLQGHPPVENFMALPFTYGEEIAGIIGLANAPGGYSERLARRLESMVTACASLVWAYRANQRRQEAEDKLLKLNAELEERVRQRTIELEATNRELESFSYSVSHDLRAPLRGIDGWSLALLEDFGEELAPKAREYLTQVRAEASRMMELIEDLLKLSRVTRCDMRREAVDMSALAQSIVQTLRRAEPDRQVEVAVQPGVVAQGDSNLLELVLQNLLHNAWKFTGKQPRASVEFGTVARDGTTVYFVRDNGAGFDMGYAAKLFSPFQRLHRRSEFPGTGVGLATVQRIVRRHGGSVWVEAEVGKGATFYFTLMD